jgi:hypothetical protein
MEGSDPRTDGELLIATAGDPAAFGVFYRRHVRGVLARACNLRADDG